LGNNERTVFSLNLPDKTNDFIFGNSMFGMITVKISENCSRHCPCKKQEEIKVRVLIRKTNKKIFVLLFKSGLDYFAEGKKKKKNLHAQ
jgi:hypothetical protein